jgi:hypothetical protein
MIHKALRLTGDTRNSGPLTEHDGGIVNGVFGCLVASDIDLLAKKGFERISRATVSGQSRLSVLSH